MTGVPPIEPLDDLAGKPGRILVVEDESLNRAQILHTLARGQYQVFHAASFEQALTQLGSHLIDLAILGLKLTDLDPFEACRRLRATHTKLGLILLAPLAETRELVRGLASGADDFLFTPFHAEELAARTMAILRRVKGASPSSHVVESRNLKIELNTQKCLKNGRDVGLTPKEFHLLAELSAHRGQAVSRATLFSSVWGVHHHGSDKSLDVYIGRLRQKIEDNPAEPALIQTVRGCGYVFE